MLIEIVFKCCGEDIYDRVQEFPKKDRDWFHNKCLSSDKSPLKMGLDEVIRMLKLFNKVEKIYFEVR